ncbi:MAG: hypothetical protein V2I36_11050, partial [Desulfopila sp.]|nr:hypothetical protein [Desulfopila sp.]
CILIAYSSGTSDAGRHLQAIYMRFISQECKYRLNDIGRTCFNSSEISPENYCMPDCIASVTLLIIEG